MPDKQSFYQSINETASFDHDFFKKVYAYSVYDDLFLSAVANKLISIGRKDIVQAYNEWFFNWKAEDYKAMKNVAIWYHKECNKEFERFQKEQQGKAVEEWKQRKITLLKEKKKLLLLTEK